MARKSIKILNGRASALPPTEKFPRWRVIWTDPVTGKRRQTSGGDSLDSAKAKAAEILGDYVSDSESGVRPPTFDECFHSWMDAKKPQIAEQTAANYVYVYQRFIKPEIGEQSITAIGQRSIRAIQVSGVEFPILVKRIIKGVFEQAENWTHRPADHYADCIVIRSSRNEKRRDYVARGDIPSSKLVASFIITAYGTLQQNPLDDPAVTVWNPESATHKRSARRMSFAPGLGLTQPDDTCFRNGVPFETIYPDYQKPEEIKDDANRHATRLAFMNRKAMICRRVGLITALGAGGGLRIGEVLALRVRHILTREQVALRYQLGQSREESAWRGETHVCEQITRGGAGQMRLTTPKYDHDRIVHIPAFLPNWNGFGLGTHRTQIAGVIPRFADPQVSLWTATDEEVRTLWQAGFTPLGWLYWRHLDELWTTMPRTGKPSMQEEIDAFMNLLLFPSVSRGIPSKSEFAIDPNWPYDASIPEGTGGYQHPSNYMKHSALIYDYVAQIHGEWPINRVNSKTRKGWTHHSLRHYAASSRIQAGVPLPIVARELGHKDAAFTLQRYGHMMADAIPETGFDY